MGIYASFQKIVLQSFASAAFFAVPCLAQTWQVLNPSKSQNIVESRHFVVRYDNDDGVTLTSSQIQTGLGQLEKYWNYYVDSIGFKQPYDGSTTGYKVDVWVAKDNYYASGSGTSDSHPEMWVNNDGFLAGDWALVHELMHCFQYCTRSFRDSKFVGWFWETHAEFSASLYNNDIRNVEFQVDSPHLHAGSTRFRYGQWIFLEYIKDQYGISAVNDMWNKAYKPDNSSYLKEEPFLVLARNKGWSQGQLNDEFGKYAMHNVTWDYKRKSILKKAFSYKNLGTSKQGRITILDTMNLSKRRFQVPSFQAPQRWGYNLVRLYPDKGVSSVRVTFQGVAQTVPEISKFDKCRDVPSTVPAPHSGWRWGIVAVSRDGSPRYSELQSSHSGILDVPVNQSDSSLWLVVLGAPEQNESLFWNQSYNSIYRYPWMAQFENAYPEGYQVGADSLPAGTRGARHSNGGGWVASTATVGNTAYIGPHALVLETAKVLGNARIDGYACVKGSAVVKDSAVVTGHAIVAENAQIYGKALVTDEAGVYGTSKIYGNAVVKCLSCVTGSSVICDKAVAGSVEYAEFNGRTLSGTAQALADIDLTTNLSSGIYIGGEIAAASDDTIAASRTVVPGEVTIMPPYTWDETSAITANRIVNYSGKKGAFRIIDSRLRLTGWPDGILRVFSVNAAGRVMWKTSVVSVNGFAEAKIPSKAAGWRHIVVNTLR